MRFVAKWAIASLGLAAFGATFCQGLPRTDGPKACTMTRPDGTALPFHLTNGKNALVVDLGDGAVYTFPKNMELSDARMSVGALGSPTAGSISVLIDDEGKYQQTILLPGRSPEFFYGECEK